MNEIIPPDYYLPLPVPELPVAAIFDCDGTLVDTMPLHFVAWRKTLDDLGHMHVFPETQFYEWGGTPALEIIERLNAMHTLAMLPHETATAKEENYARLLDNIAPLDRVVAEAHRFFAAGIPLAVASGGRRDLVEASLRAVGIRDLFRFVIGSEDVTHGKPAPDVFLRAAELLGIAPEACIVYEDAPNGVLAAFRAGMKVVDVTQYL